MNCSERKDQLLLYVLGELDRPEAGELRTHLATGCPTCEGHLAEAKVLISMIPLSLPSAPPPAGAKARLLERVRTSDASSVSPLRITQPAAGQQSRSMNWLKPAAFGAVAASVLLGVIFWRSLIEEKRKLTLAQETILRKDGEIVDFKTRQKLSVDELMMVASPKMKLVKLDGAGQPAAKGFVCWDPASRHFFFCAAGLRKLEPNITYELWLVDSMNAMKKPVPGGTFQADENGEVVLPIATDSMPESSNLVASAVTIEPGNGGEHPSNDKFQIISKLQ